MPHDLSHELVAWIRSHYFGKYRGTVTDNADPDSCGRLQVKVPAVLDDLAIWAMPCVPYAGNKVGFYSMPPRGSGVWVEFEGGDPSYPVWSGCFWARNELPDSAEPGVNLWQTDALTVSLDDKSSSLTLKNSVSSVVLSDDITLDSSEATLTVGIAGIVSEQGAGKLEVTTAAVIVNNGAFEVI